MRTIIVALILAAKISGSAPAGGGAAKFPVNGTTATITEASGVITATGNSATLPGVSINNSSASGTGKVVSFKHSGVELFYLDFQTDLNSTSQFGTRAHGSNGYTYAVSNVDSGGAAGTPAFRFANLVSLNSKDPVRKSYPDNFATPIETLQANGCLNIAGTLAQGLQTVNGSTSISPAMAITLVGALGAPATMTLPSASQTAIGATYTVKDAACGAATNNITVSRGGTNIDSSATYVISANCGFVSVTWDGSNWVVVAK